MTMGKKKKKNRNDHTRLGRLKSRQQDLLRTLTANLISSDQQLI